MGVNIELYRMRIRLHCIRKIKSFSNIAHISIAENVISMLAISVIIEMTLILGCVELNPGPTHEENKCCPRCGLAEISGQVGDLDDHCHVR